MDGFSWSLLLGAAAIALTHTVLGPDHYLPFVALARARRWSVARTATVTALCGVGHVVSSLLLGGLGVMTGLALSRLEQLERGRASYAAWLLVAFGLAYAAWGIRRALRRSRRSPHGRLHRHVADAGGAPGHAESGTVWALFVVFALGPCEPLVPLFILPAGRGAWALALLAALVFGAVTVATMIALTLVPLLGLRRLRHQPMERWAHTLAGGIIAASGLAVLVFGL